MGTPTEAAITHTNTRNTHDTNRAGEASAAGIAHTPAGTVAPTGLGGGSLPHEPRAHAVKTEPAEIRNAAQDTVQEAQLADWTNIVSPMDVGQVVQFATQRPGVIGTATTMLDRANACRGTDTAQQCDIHKNP